MVLPALLKPFVEGAPAALMTRIALDWISEGTPLDALVDEVAERQSPRERTRTHFVQVMLEVASGHRPAPPAAFPRRELPLVASPSARDRKLDRMALAIPAAVVRRAAARARPLLGASGGLMPEPVVGDAVRIRDGNVLTGTAPRRTPGRGTGSAGLPGRSLAVDEPASGLILDLILAEDAHCPERALVDRVEVQPGPLWVMDRHFRVRALVFRSARREAFFLVRWQRSTRPVVPAGGLRARGRRATGQVFEPPIDVSEGAGGVPRPRRVAPKWDEPTRDGETEIVLVTNRPAAVTALPCREACRGRWRIAGHDQALTAPWPCEVRGRGHPRAAPFAFGRSAVAGHALAVLKGNLRVARGAEVAMEVSDCALVEEVAEVWSTRG